MTSRVSRSPLTPNKRNITYHPLSACACSISGFIDIVLELYMDNERPVHPAKHRHRLKLVPVHHQIAGLNENQKLTPEIPNLDTLESDHGVVFMRKALCLFTP